VYVCANVISAQPPELSTFVNAMKGILGLIESIADLGAGWIREIAPPQACRILTVLWHEPCPLGTPQSGESVSIQAITSLDQLPCEWTGTGHGSIHHSLGAWDEVGEISGTVTFGNPRLVANSVMYDVISLSGTWQGSEVMPEICSFSDSGTYDEPQGALIVTDNGSGQLTYDGYAGGSVGDPVTGCLGLFDLDNALFFYTCSGNWPLIDLDLSGNCVSDDVLGTDDEFDWHLSGIACSGPVSLMPQGPPVCVGPTPVP